MGCEDGEGKKSMIDVVMFDNAKELMAGRMKEYCEHKGIWIDLSIPSHLSIQATWCHSRI